MPNVPAVCDHCGIIFRSPLEIEGAHTARLSGNTVRCPRCQKLARIPDGLYRFTGSVIELLSAPDRSHLELERIGLILREARDGRLPPAAVALELKRQAPGIGAQLANLLTPKSPSDFYAMAGVIIAALALIASLKQGPTPQPSVTIEQVFNYYGQVAQPSALPTPPGVKQPPPAHSSPAAKPRKGAKRNKPCVCGSGQKTKKCGCGAK